jgi:uncharacterized membrane protein
VQSKHIRKLGQKANAANLHQLLLFSSAFSMFLLVARVILSGSYFYLFLPWNLFLAFIPYWVSGVVQKLPVTSAKGKSIFIFLLLIILLFIPNSFYIVTDLFHLKNHHSAPVWYDLILIFSFAWNGIVCGIIALNRVETIITKMIGKEYSVFIIFVIMCMSAFGVYIGRFLRYNSWDILVAPFALLEEIINIMVHPLQNIYPWGMTICYAVVMTFVYLTIKRVSEIIHVPAHPGNQS